jgi:hypothetical protein
MNLSDVLNGVQLHPALAAAVPVLIVLGYALKNSPKVPDWTIVWILIVVGVMFGIFGIGFTFEGVLNGVIAGGLAIASHQAYKQTKEK